MALLRFFDPLPEDHPLVAECVRCFFCDKAFFKGDITCLVPKEEPDPAGPAYQTLEARVVHAACLMAKHIDGSYPTTPQ